LIISPLLSLIRHWLPLFHYYWHYYDIDFHWLRFHWFWYILLLLLIISLSLLMPLFHYWLFSLLFSIHFIIDIYWYYWHYWYISFSPLFIDYFIIAIIDIDIALYMLYYCIRYYYWLLTLRCWHYWLLILRHCYIIATHIS
jgi:hypothetical protein